MKELNSPQNALRYYTVTDFKRFVSQSKQSSEKPLSAVRSSISKDTKVLPETEKAVLPSARRFRNMSIGVTECAQSNE